MPAELRATTIAFEGPAVAWDPDDQAVFRALAGRQFLRVEHGNAVVLTEDGHETAVYPGWLVILPDGSVDGQALFSAPTRARVAAGEPAGGALGSGFSQVVGGVSEG